MILLKPNMRYGTRTALRKRAPPNSQQLAGSGTAAGPGQILHGCSPQGCGQKNESKIVSGWTLAARICFKIVFQCFVPGIQGPWHPGVSRFLHVVGTLSQCQCSFVCSKGMWWFFAVPLLSDYGCLLALLLYDILYMYMFLVHVINKSRCIG